MSVLSKIIQILWSGNKGGIAIVINGVNSFLCQF